MATITVVRPTSTIFNNWTRVGGTTIHGVLADNSDATYIHPTGSAGSRVVQTGIIEPAAPANHGLHRFRARARASAPTPAPAVTFVTFRDGQPGGSTLTTSVPVAVTNYSAPWVLVSVLAANHQWNASTNYQPGSPELSGQARFYEAYVDFDFREIPTFTPDVLDGAGASVSGGTITDTNIPRYVFGGYTDDGLTARNWTLNVYDTSGPDVLVDSRSGNGNPPFDPFTGADLPNSTYRADFQMFTTIGVNRPHPSAVMSISFTVAFVPPEAPDLTTSPTASPPSIEVCWTVTPGVTEWDDDDLVVTEIRRTDCNGTQTIFVGVDFEGCWEDRFMSLSYDGVFCGDSDHVCVVCYEARQWGLVDAVVVSTEWSAPACENSLANPTPGNAWIRGGDTDDLSICPDESFGINHPFGSFQPIAGGIPTVVTGAPGGRDYTLTIPVTSEADLGTLLGILGQAVVYYQPVAAPDVWLSAMPRQVQVTKVGRIRVVDVSFVAVNPQPQPDPASLVT